MAFTKFTHHQTAKPYPVSDHTPNILADSLATFSNLKMLKIVTSETSSSLPIFSAMWSKFNITINNINKNKRIENYKGWQRQNVLNKSSKNIYRQCASLQFFIEIQLLGKIV